MVRERDFFLMITTVSPSPVLETFPETFHTSPGERKDLPDGHLKDLIQHHHLAECSMCGDVGLQEELFKCIKCQVRHQHTYCSRSYPDRRSYSGVCDWCDTGEETDSLENGKSVTTICESECTKVLTWRNDLEMLLAAAEVSRKVAVEGESLPTSVLFASVRCKKISWSGTKRPRRPSRTKPAAPVSSSIFKCKNSKLEASNFSKRIGRRYKCILDVY